jgi:HD-GYP domain-containing protein (c-di-GMP phosphodiesterase class II)
MIETVLRAVLAFPPSPGDQLPLCEGLDAVVEAVDERVAALTAGLVQRRRETGQIEYLAEIFRRLAAGQAVAPQPVAALAVTIVREARQGQPLRFLHASPQDPARFAAAHGLTVAQVLARVLLENADPQTPIELAAMAALVHDVGMACVPTEVLGKPGPLTDEERRLVERHAAAGGPMVATLWPGGGWPVDAVTDHHERPDGTGYPHGRKDIQVAEPVRLLAICDVYAAMCCRRPHRPAFDSRTALTETLLLAERNALDRQQAERLLQISFYPAGSVVELSDAAVALVLAAQPGARGLANPARPVVLLLTDAQAQPLAWPRVADLAEEKDRSVVRALAPAERRRLLGRRYPELVS